jgi:hypothetical protein
VEALGAAGAISDLDDGVEQRHIEPDVIKAKIISKLAEIGVGSFETVITHNISGEYTYHRRHEEISAAVCEMWIAGQIQARELWLLAYEDSGPGTIPRAIADAPIVTMLPEQIWRRKREIITEIYGFGGQSFEANAAGKVEAFRNFSTRDNLAEWLSGRAIHENPGLL